MKFTAVTYLLIASSAVLAAPSPVEERGVGVRFDTHSHVWI
jgi:hypothetical protein